jgi:hypothetical protein
MKVLSTAVIKFTEVALEIVTPCIEEKPDSLLEAGKAGKPQRSSVR